MFEYDYLPNNIKRNGVRVGVYFRVVKKYRDKKKIKSNFP